MLRTVPNSSRTAKRKADVISEKQRQRARRMLAEVRSEVKEFAGGVRINIDPTAAVQALLDGAFQAWQYAQMQMLQLKEDEYFEEQMGMTVPHAWIREEDRLAGKVLTIAAKAAAMGLAERKVQMEEAQAALFGQVVEAALKEAGLSAEQRHKIHVGIAQGLEDIEGTVVKELAA